jgi:polyphenol oxidase
MNPDWLIPDWPVPPHVKAVFTSRAGGLSVVPFDSMNLGDHVGDLTADVAANRRKLQTAIVAKPVFLQQVHGTHAVMLAPNTASGTVADACITMQKKLACTIMVADCLPVFFTDVEGRFVAAAHAGWRGLADGVLKQNIQSINSLSGVNIACKAIEIIAWLGPCIGPAAFEVGAEVKAVFATKLAGSASFFAQTGNPESGKWLADLAGLARLQLKQLGLEDDQIFGNDSSAGWCTVNNPLRFFSHRRDAVKLGSSGRMAGCIWLE